MNSDPGSKSPRSLLALWLGVIGPPVIWLTQFEMKYALAGVGRTGRHEPLLITTTIVSIALVLLVGYTAVRERQIASESPLDAQAGVLGRNRFLATLGVMSSALFLLVILAQAAADFFFVPGVS